MAPIFLIEKKEGRSEGWQEGRNWGTWGRVGTEEDRWQRGKEKIIVTYCGPLIHL